MKKHIVIISTIIAMSLITTTYALKSSSNSESGKELLTRTPLYTVSEFNGRLAVFEYNSVIPIEIYDIYINTLPDLDYQKIQEGISVYTQEGLDIIVDDYTS